MTAWEALRAASTLVVGTAWELLTSPKTGGAGLVINDGVHVEVAAMEVEATVADAAITAELADTAVVAEVSTAAIEVEVYE